MKGIGKEIYSFNKILGSLEKNRITGLSGEISSIDNRITSLTEEMSSTAEKITKIAAQGIKLYKLSINKDTWAYNVNSTGDTAHLNSWHWFKYPVLATVPTLPLADKSTYTAEKYFLDSAITYNNMAIGDSYTAKCQTYLYCDTAKDIAINFISDDAGTVWLNKTQITTITSCAWTGNITCSFKAGWNELVVLYTESTGGDGWQTSPRLYNHSAFRLMCADLNGYTQSVEAIPVGHNIALTSNTVLSELMFVPSGQEFPTDQLIRDQILSLNQGIIKAQDGEILLQTIGNHPDINIECYILAKEYN